MEPDLVAGSFVTSVKPQAFAAPRCKHNKQRQLIKFGFCILFSDSLDTRLVITLSGDKALGLSQPHITKVTADLSCFNYGNIVSESSLWMLMIFSAITYFADTLNYHHILLKSRVFPL